MEIVHSYPLNIIDKANSKTIQSSGNSFTFNHPNGNILPSLSQQTIEEIKTIIKALQIGIDDRIALTNLIFFSRHPNLNEESLVNNPVLKKEWEFINQAIVHPTLEELQSVLGGEIDEAFFPEQLSEKGEKINIKGGTNYHFDRLIRQAVEWCPGLSPQMLKGLLAQESNFQTKVINQYGYAGIAQFGKTSAREVGLKIGVSGTASDERLDPGKAIPAAARLLKLKAQRLAKFAFAEYGMPKENEYWKFVLAAYNGGEATVSLAMGNAYREGIKKAQSLGLVGIAVTNYAHSFASQWDNLLKGGLASPLGLAASRFFPAIAAQKYREIGNYPIEILKRLK